MINENTRTRRFKSKLDAQQAAKKIYCCEACRAQYEATKIAQCRECKHTTAAMKSKRDNQCPNCARPALKNRYMPPIGCKACGSMEFILFDSKAEAAHFATLAMLQDNGKITDLRRQVPFIIKLKDGKEICKYVADFVYRDKRADGSTGEQRIIDVKGHEAAVDGLFKLKKKLVEAFYPGVTVEVFTP